MFEIQVDANPPTATTRTYTNHRIDAEFIQVVSGSSIPGRVTSELTEEGVAKLELPDRTALSDLTLRVRAPDGRLLLELTNALSALPLGNSVTFTPSIDPAGDDTAFEIRISVTRPATSPPPESAIDYSGHRVVASFTRLVETASGTELIVGKATANLSSGTGSVADPGLAYLSLPNLTVLTGTVVFQLFAPDGTELLETPTMVSVASLLAYNPPPPFVPYGLSLEAFPVAVFGVDPNTSAGFGKPTKVRGRIVDRAGTVKLSGRQLLLFAKPQKLDIAGDPIPAASDPSAVFLPLLVTQTLSGGYFSAPYPVGFFEEAYAVVGKSERLTVPIRLEADERGRKTLPPRLLLVVEATAEDVLGNNDECDCNLEVPRFTEAEDMAAAPEIFAADLGNGECVSFNRPNRTLDQFNFTKVVRTTEPEVRGLVLHDMRTVPLQFLVDTLPPAPETPNKSGLLNFIAGTGGYTPHDAHSTMIDLELAEALVAEPATFTVAKLIRALYATDQKRASNESEQLRAGETQRSALSVERPIDWDASPTIFQASTIAHGHLLHFKQEWLADGYSLGDLLYSLPLAPAQKKMIAVVDWERRETAGRTESLEARESLASTLTRDRDISEIVTGLLREDIRGGSSAHTSSFAGGGGIAAGIPLGSFGFLGIAGGASGGKGSASSSAWQTSSRDTVATSLQELSDRTGQASEAIRNQRATVIQTVTESEAVAVTTEVVANHNHCHALTVQYFEVLRHFLVRQRLVNVEECLLVPFLLSPFDSRKALRWRGALMPALLNRSLRPAFDAIERIQNSYLGSDIPKGRFADEEIDELDGFIRLRFMLARPRDNDDGSFNPHAWSGVGRLLPSITPFEFWANFIRNQEAQKDRAFLEQMGPRIAAAFVDAIRVTAVLEGLPEVEFPIDATLTSKFVNDTELYVSLRLAEAPPPVQRKQIRAVRISVDFGTASNSGLGQLLENSRAIVESGQLRYRLRHSSGDLFKKASIRNDLDSKDGVLIFTPLNSDELRNPREEDQALRLQLLDHLDENLELYHRVIWFSMNPDRRYMLLDGVIAPNSNGRSVASVVENRLIGIAGNTLIFPVVPGLHLDPTVKRKDDATGLPLQFDLIDLYQPETPAPVARFALPTKGVFAEAVTGECNACEQKDESRFWRWEESPSPDEPPQLQSPSGASRRTEPPNLQPTQLPSPLVNLQNAPGAPDPTGITAALQSLGTPGIFKDITGLTENQKNALAALQSSFGAAQAFGQQATNLALQASMSKDVDKILRGLKDANQKGIITKESMNERGAGAIRAMFGGGAQQSTKAPDADTVSDLVETVGPLKASARVTQQGSSYSVTSESTASADSLQAKPVILLPEPENSPDSRAFFPSRFDKSGAIRLRAAIRNAPPGATVRWSTPNAGTLSIEAPDSLNPRILGLVPGVTLLDVVLREEAGAALASVKLVLSVPQFVTIDEDAAAFNAALTALHVFELKTDIVREARAVVDHLLSPVNVRTVWRIPPFAEAVPSHLSDSVVTRLTIRNEPPGTSPGLAGQTMPGPSNANPQNPYLGIGPGFFDERIDIYPGAFDNNVSGDVDDQTRALVALLNQSSPELAELSRKVIGRLIGHTIAHEIGHSVIGATLGASSNSTHNDPPIAHELMNRGVDQNFADRTGLLQIASPFSPASIQDNGIQAIGGFQANSLSLLSVFPVPPEFK